MHSVWNCVCSQALEPISQDAGHVVIKDEAGQVRGKGAGLAVCDWLVKAAIHQKWSANSKRHSIEAAASVAVDATGHKPILASPERSRYSREHVGSAIHWLVTLSAMTTNSTRYVYKC